MAVTQIHAIETTLTKAIDYISDPDKTDQTLLISGYNCTPEMAAYEFEMTKKSADKQGGVLAYHLIQSFAPGEVEYYAAHEIGKQLADKHLKGEFEYIIATHIDRDHIHNHIIFNSVPTNGKNKYRSTIPSYFNIREESDRLCHENNLSVIEQPSGNRGKSYKEYTAEKDGTSWKAKLREAIDRCILQARDFEDFLALMKAEDYEVKQGKHIAFRSKDQERFTRAKTLGDRYTEKNIKAQIYGRVNTAPAVKPETKTKTEHTGISLLIDIENRMKIRQSESLSHWAKVKNLKMAAMTVCYLSDNGLLDYSALAAKHDEIKSKRNAALSKIKEIEKRVKELKTQIEDLDTFRKTKPVVEKLDSVIFKDKYRREHETDFILHNAAKQALKIHFPDKRYPLIKTLRAELSELYNEKSKLYPEYYEAKDEMKNISTIKRNVDTLLENPPEREKEKERNNDIIHF